jgi:hypothetical protein
MGRCSIAAITFAAIVFSFGCSKNKKSSRPSVSAPSSYSMSAIIVKQADSTNFSVAGGKWVTATINNNDTCKIVAIDTASDMAVSQFTFYLYPYSSVATYYLDTGNLYSISVTFADYETITPAYMQTAFDSCILKITNVTPNSISGTFNGRLTDGSTISNGAFTASFRE